MNRNMLMNETIICDCITAECTNILDDVADIEYPPQLNASILVLKNGKKYKITVEEVFDFKNKFSR